MAELGNVGLQAAKMVGESAELDAFCETVAAAARAEAAKHIRSGSFERSIHVEKVPGRRGVQDRQIVADSVDASWFELGHVASGWYADIAPGTWIPGRHVLRNVGTAFGGY